MEGSEWHSVAQDIETTLNERKLKLLLLGNSITQGWGGMRKLVSYKPGKQAMDDALGQGNWESAGISGDRTQNLLWRVRYGNYNRCTPEYVVIAIGINNLVVGQDTADDTAEGIIAVTEEPAGSSLIQRLSCWDFSLPERSRAVQSVNSATAFINCWARIPSELRSVTQILQAGFLTKMERFVTDFTAAIIFTSQTKVMLV